MELPVIEHKISAFNYVHTRHEEHFFDILYWKQ